MLPFEIVILFPCACVGFQLPLWGFPVTFSSNCFINIIASQSNYSTTDKENYIIAGLSDQNFNQYSESKLYPFTWTIHHDLNPLNLAISTTELLESDTSASTFSQRYFRFSSRYQPEECHVVIIFADTFNGTVYAVNAIGYGTSNQVLYLVGISELDQNTSEIWQGFSQDLRGGVDEEGEFVPFHAPLAFFVVENRNRDFWQDSHNDEKGAWYEEPIYVYCYFCPLEELGKFHPINAKSMVLEKQIPSVSEVKEHWSQWNSQGYGHKIVLHSPGDWEYKDTSRINCTRGDRKLYDKMNRCHYAEMLVYNNLDDALNMTYAIYRNVFKDKEMNNIDDWFLNINTDEWSMGTVVVNVYAATRGSYQIFQEVGYKFIYCNPRSQITYLAWDIFWHVFDTGTWLTFFGVIVVYAAFTRRILYSMDLIWPFLGMSTWKTHPRAIMGVYLVAVGFFLQNNYNSGTSTDFIQMKSPMQASSLFRAGYKTWVPGVTDSSGYVNMIYEQAPEFLRKKVHELIGKPNLGDIMYKPPEKSYSMPRKPLEMIRDLVRRHLVVASVGLPRYNSLMQVFSTVNWAIIHDNIESYLCGGVDVPRHIHIPKRRHASRTWGFLSDRAAILIGRWFEMGFVKRMQVLLDYKLLLSRPIDWKDAGKISEQMPVGVNSPLGITCLGLVIMHLGNFLCFVSFLFYNRRRQMWMYLLIYLKPNHVQSNWLA